MSGSEIARFREQQSAEEQAAHNGLYGSAITTRHDFIIQRIEQGANQILELFEQGRTEEALALWDASNFGLPSLESGEAQ